MRAIILSALTAGFAALSACSDGASPADKGTESPAPLRIMWVEPLTGPLASVGRPALDTWRFAVNEINESGGVLGRPLALETCDNKGAARESAECVERAADGGIQYIAQGMSSAAAGAVLDAVNKHNDRNPDEVLLYLNWAAQAERLTGDLCSYWQFRFEPHIGMRAAALAAFLGERGEAEKLYLLNQDYSLGQSAEESLQRELARRAPAVEIVAVERHPFNRVTDWRPYVDKIAQSGATAVFTANWGPDLLRLIKTADEAGLDLDWYTIFGNLRGTAAVIGDAGAGRLYVVADYHPNVEDPEWTARQRRYEAEIKDELVDLREFRTLEMFRKAAELAGSVEPREVAAALEGLELQMGKSSVRMRPDDHQAIMPLVIAVMSRDVAFDQDETGLGFKTVTWIPAESLAPELSCKMANRPE